MNKVREIKSRMIRRDYCFNGTLKAIPLLQNNWTICWWGEKIYLLTFLSASDDHSFMMIKIVERYSEQVNIWM
jgi:hypothetical protein